MNKFFAKFFAGATGGFLLGWIGFITGIILYSINYQAGSRIGMATGVIIGSLIGVLLVKKEKYSKKQYAVIAFLSIILFIYENYITGSNLEIFNNLMLMQIVIFLIPPLILATFINWQKPFKSKQSNSKILPCPKSHIKLIM